MEKLIVKNLSQLKKQVTPGMIIESNNMLKGTHKQRLILKTNTVSIISKEFVDDGTPSWGAPIETDENGRKYVDYYTDYQKARNMRFRENGDVEFIAYDRDSHGRKVRVPSPDFDAGQPWLIVKIFKN